MSMRTVLRILQRCLPQKPAPFSSLVFLCIGLLSFSVGCSTFENHVAIYSNVTGACFSVSGKARDNRSPQYALHETRVSLDEENLETLLSGLELAGFFEDSGRALAPFALPVMAFHISVVTAEQSHDCTYHYQRGLTVPESYLKILERSVPQPHPPALRKFLRANREL